MARMVSPRTLLTMGKSMMSLEVDYGGTATISACIKRDKISVRDYPWHHMEKKNLNRLY